MPASNYLAHKWLDMLGGTAFTAPATVYAALFTTKPGLDAAGGVEVSGTGYVRKAVTWGAAASRQKANSSAIEFHASAPAAWGTIVAFGLYDALTAGNLLWVDNADPQLVVGIGSPVPVAIGQLAVIFSS